MSIERARALKAELDALREKTCASEEARKEHRAKYEVLAEMVRNLPNPVKAVDDKIREARKSLEALEAEKTDLIARCEHLAWDALGVFDAIDEQCIQCGKREGY